MSARSASASTIFPFPSSPHWAPTTTVHGIARPPNRKTTRHRTRETPGCPPASRHRGRRPFLPRTQLEQALETTRFGRDPRPARIHHASRYLLGVPEHPEPSHDLLVLLAGRFDIHHDCPWRRLSRRRIRWRGRSREHHGCEG